MEFIATQLESIARSLERIANHLEGEVLVEMRVPKTTAEGLLHSSSDAYDTAVAGLKAMVDDIPAAPVKEEKPVTKAEIVAALNQHAKLHGIESSKKILASFGPKLDAIDTTRYGDLLAQLGVKA